ncbi:ciliated left-right organizer metallopeptidase-like [Argopecten irradians]|uniref:ciliated left-right organizer metallopeptidase-like n=1 Tax=Argopecten irradians TaxID=31199 RepID=UPI0037158106
MLKLQDCFTVFCQSMMRCYLFMILVLMLNHGVYTSCVHDDVQTADPVKFQVNYDGVKSAEIFKRSTSSNSIHKPIRLKFFKLDFDFELSEQERDRIQTALTDAVNFIQKTFSVIPVSGSLLLKRTGCQKTWHKEPHTGKCASLNKAYRYEYCQDGVKIPETHLGSLKVWRINKEGVEGEEVFPAGEGIEEADTVLYITAKTTRTCYLQQNDIMLAYSGYCQLDQYDRPIAGYINFCPYLIRATNMTKQQVYMIVVHEFFHALGFSKGLFDKFRDCTRSVGGECPRRTSRVVRQIYGVARLVTSAVITQAQEHFGCLTEERFGAPLQVKNGKVLSHWSPKLMFGSIMAPKLGMAHQTVIDPLTLAFFEDTGWYKVDYSQAGHYLWGKDGGCQFGSPESCQKDSQFFCQSGRYKSCHYLQKDKGHCRMVDRYCGMVESDQGDQCFQTYDHTPKLEMYSESSLCFMANLTTMVPGYYGYVKCPEVREIVCPLVEETVVITTAEDTTTLLPVTTSHYNTTLDVTLLRMSSDISSTSSDSTQEMESHGPVSSGSTRKFHRQTSLFSLFFIMLFICATEGHIFCYDLH